MFRQERWLFAALLVVMLSRSAAFAQIDPEKRQLIQIGLGIPLEGRPPVPGYSFFYYNEPGFMRTNLTLRLAVAPVYLDSELGFKGLLGPNTDLGLGISGGGFADSYYEVRGGKFIPEESFVGHGGTLTGSLYHLFNPDQLIPLNLVFHGDYHYAAYGRDSETADTFNVPDNLPSYDVTAGFRFGGMEPVVSPEVAMELSAWYAGKFRAHSELYGYPTNGLSGDREMNSYSHLFWTRALLAYTLPESRQNFMASITAGTSINADRFSTYRLGGLLPLASEFPLTLPGYYYQEISAWRFALINGNYSFPIDPAKRWAVNVMGSAAVVDYLPGLEQPGNFQSGVGGGISYRSTSGSWQILVDYGYGFNAIRSHGYGAQSIGVIVQWNLVRTADKYYNPGTDNMLLRGLGRFLHSFD